MTRDECWAFVMRREKGRCQRCGGRARGRVPEWHPRRAHVNEILPRSKGGDPTDPDNCELLCRECHMPGGQHAPTDERWQKLRRPAKEWP